MTRIRIGQRWRREPAASPLDSIALELDGVDLLSGAVEESLAEVVPSLVRSVAAIIGGRQRLAQVSLPEAHLELVLRRVGPEVELLVANLSRPARLMRPPVRVEVEELAEAVREGGERFLADVTRGAPRALAQSVSQAMAEPLKALRRAARPPEEPPGKPSLQRVEPQALPGFGFELRDVGLPVNRTTERGTAGALAPLLTPGEVWLSLPGKPEAWRVPGPPFLTVLELSRQAVELARAVELGEERFELAPAGARPTLVLDLKPGKAKAGRTGTPFPLDGGTLATALFHLGESLAATFAEADRALVGNPYLVELADRCREGLSHLRGAVEPPEAQGAAREKKARPGRGTSRPLKVPGRLRRLRFDKLWEKRGLEDAEEARLLLGRHGPVYCAPQLAVAFSRKDGAQLWKRAAALGVAASADGNAVAADMTRVYGFTGRGAGARWLHDHDGIPLGPLLLRKDGLLLTLSEDRTVVAFAEATGREVWRLAPPRTQRSWLSTQGHRALVGTDSGYLYGLDLVDGQVRYRMRAPMPFHCPPVPWGRRFLSMLGRGSHWAVLLADAHTGEAVWTHEPDLLRPCVPLPVGQRVFIAGEREREGYLLCLDAKGRRVWERPLNLGPGPYALAPLPRAVVVTSASGAAARVSASGTVDWRVGAAGEPLIRALPARTARGVTLVPGERVRAVDPRGGQVLAEVRVGVGLVALQADVRLNLFFLDDTGTLSAYRLTSHFTVVE
ncbi:PQQ-binding-like beta-propeller repeat protein [Pyxidicoccus fallax]|uniref:PQQ-binding-like beta-propeller repeat protein n=1 Tax=Pyxidicoccus fallax TaxID=394095 RepID=A0A848LSR6_9BACT|nr:PQQ-binding-like beta-propeller repeat protein [Pyxidicoccus fallax]NMO20731.1 PQQ-binding-like beta-propeller repeat protein [Pyxidicoccus fallax]NPC81720.1 PQQ-binding-like beta-propeller repeat protein [Pyxidicoccus fallax]